LRDGIGRSRAALAISAQAKKLRIHAAAGAFVEVGHLSNAFNSVLVALRPGLQSALCQRFNLQLPQFRWEFAPQRNSALLNSKGFG
jgi:hypothetical protein